MKNSESWERVGEDVVAYKNYMTVVKRAFRLPSGNVKSFDIIKDIQAVCMLALTSDNQVLLVKEFRPGVEKVLMELPGGGVEKGEEPEVAAERELLEETEYKGEVQFVTESFHDAYSTRIRYNFVIVDCKKVQEVNHDIKEPLEPVLLSIGEFRKHLQSGQLTDVTTGYLGLDFLDLL